MELPRVPLVFHWLFSPGLGAEEETGNLQNRDAMTAITYQQHYR